MNNKRTIKFVEATIFVLSLVLSTTVISTSVTTIEKNNVHPQDGNHLGDMITHPYNGHLRIYIVEPLSRWNNADKKPYHFGFLDFALDETFSIPYSENYTKNITWSSQEAGYNNVKKNNIMVIAAVFNPEVHKKYAYPPFKNPFNAYYVDATAAATPDSTGYNIVTENFTHTVFCEEATASWCHYCPQVADALYNIYQSNVYPFYFVALIADKTQKAYDRLLFDYNLYGYPTCFFDGGYKVVLGASTESTFKHRIESCGKRDVHDLNLSLSVEWQEEGILSIHVMVKNNEETQNNPPSTPEIYGPTHGKPNKEYIYHLLSFDPEGDDISYHVYWGDTILPLVYGPYPSGENITVTHIWTEKGSYTIRVQAVDIYDAKSEWSELTISMPRYKNNRFSMIKFNRELLELLIPKVKTI